MKIERQTFGFSSNVMNSDARHRATPVRERSAAWNTALRNHGEIVRPRILIEIRFSQRHAGWRWDR